MSLLPRLPRNPRGPAGPLNRPLPQHFLGNAPNRSSRGGATSFAAEIAALESIALDLTRRWLVRAFIPPDGATPVSNSPFTGDAYAVGSTDGLKRR